MRTIKYGLTSALRAFEEPQEWTGSELITVTGATLVADITEEKKRTVTYTVHEHSTQDICIERSVLGNCDTAVRLHVGVGATITVHEKIRGSGALRSATTVLIEPTASVTYNILEQLDTAAIALLHYEATLKESAIHWLFCGIGGDTVQAHIATNAGEHSTVVNNAVIFGTGTQQFDIHVSTNHIGAKSTSNMLTRSVLDDRARAIYHGLIHIGPDSPECDSYQKDEVILLSDRAGADAIPNLEIQNNTVRCSHGASIGKLDQEKLFYFQSRGMSPHDAKQMITEGFLFSIAPTSFHDCIREKAQSNTPAREHDAAALRGDSA